MDGEEGGGAAEFDGEVAVTDCVHAVLGDLGASFCIDEAEVFGDGFPVEGEGGAGEGAASQGEDAGALGGIGEAVVVAFEHFHVGEEVVGEVDGLGALEVGIAGQESIGVLCGELGQGVLEGTDFLLEREDFLEGPEAHVQGDLVIAGAAGMEFGAGGCTAGEFRLDIHVDVFEFDFPLELAVGYFTSDGVEVFGDGFDFGGGKDSDFGEHARVRNGAADILAPESPVEGDGFTEPGEVGGGAGGEAAATGGGARFFSHRLGSFCLRGGRIVTFVHCVGELGWKKKEGGGKEEIAVSTTPLSPVPSVPPLVRLG